MSKNVFTERPRFSKKRRCGNWESCHLKHRIPLAASKFVAWAVNRESAHIWEICVEAAIFWGGFQSLMAVWNALWAQQDHSKVDLTRGSNSVNFCESGNPAKSDKIWQSGKSVKNVVHNTCVFLSILTNSNYGVSKKIRCKHRGGGGATSFQGMRIARRGAFGTRQQIPPGAAESRRSAGKKCSLDPTSTFPRDQDDSS